ncbi:penicillin-binding protein 2 [Advenella mimigardefordensis]|uniref:Peptidoglycan D,D-transpeptidase MrdA n=1 Tax=Advenella mimigardefordensis (strain DSM 17166 / LMG 22922 / DPN7) TaxID=1247726 RepID=W0P8E0_ADVMD|nr:penicillin-binding protein 2 [Advenella mimigardefordensis]AHG63006.1 penicillin-binding protein 2 [Advenella mimigardefordensis DPN7]
MFEFRKRSTIQRKKIRLRVLVALVFVLGCFGLLIDRLWVLQVERYQGLAERADRNRIALVPIAPRRGDIVDRNGMVLARSYRDYTLEIVPAQVKNLDELITQISAVIPLTPLDIRRFKRRMGQTTRYASVMLRGNLTDDEAAVFAAHSFRFPDVNLRARWVREYPQGESAAHVVGYVGRISERDQERLEQDGVEGNYRGTDVIGKKGIEASYEAVLHGKTGWEEVEVAASGKPVQVLKRIDPIPGDTLHLSIDMGLQKMVEDLYSKGFVKEGMPERGALVALDPRNGQVLAYVSAPSYDPNLFIDGIDVENWRRLADSPEHPLIDRPVSGTFPIGSTYKPFVALAALKLGVRDPNARIPDPGYFEYGNQRFRNAGGAAYGPTNMHRALVVSSDTYFFSLGPLIGVDALHDFSQLFGFGRKTGIDLDYEKIGILPSREWKKKAFKDPRQQRWIPGETISVAVGQGYNSFTIMQLAQATSTLAADGKYIRPHLVSELENTVNKTRTPTVKQPDYQIPVSQASIRLVKDALVDVTRRGTARRSFAGAAYDSAGKTGTAQVFSLKGSKYNSRNLKRNLWDHALYMGFAPANEPKIAVALIVENGGWGASIAAPIARKVFDYWLSPKRSAQVDSVPVLELDSDEPAEDTSPDVMVPQDVPANPEDKAPEHLPDILAPVGNGSGRNGAEQRQNNE